ncbi:MAG: LD-carboxypeptidase, partial [Gemmatimonadetes bacterium]|nr:LD-carboxypeptidase [Gemmatimonadota bacterium]
ALDWLQRLLTEPEPAGVLRASPDHALATRPGAGVEGRLHGGNLALVAASCGTRDALSTRGRILLLEDVGEPAYRVDRMMVQLARSGLLAEVAGLAFGRFTGGADTESEAVDAVLRRWADTVGVPAVSGLPFGHVRDHWALPLGCRAALVGGPDTLTILESAVV